VADTPTRRTRPGAPKLAWDDETDRLYTAWQRRVAAAEYGHRLMSDRLQRRHLLLGVPVVVLTTVVGTGVFASIEEDGFSTALAVVVGSVSILAAVLSSLQTFLKYSARSEGHRIAAIRYETLRRDMARVLAMPRVARGDPVRLVDAARQRMDRYAKESPAVGERLWGSLMDEFHLSRVPPDPPWEAEPVVAVQPDEDAPEG
jgi:hypothetical protein